MKKIVLTGAHGTGKTTLLTPLVELYQLHALPRTVRNFWEAHGVSDFEKLPPEIRAEFQKYLLLNQLSLENEHWDKGFITDRSVLDYLGYTLISSTMGGSDIELYKALIKERLLQYDYIIYCPVEFPAEAEYLRAHPGLQNQVAEVMETHLGLWLQPDQYCIVRGSVQERLEQIKSFVEK
jgi:deoxyadenosine/deoxycytidine kinase